MKEKILNTYTAVIVKDDDMYVAYAEELPGANTQGKTIEEAKINLKEAIELVNEANYLNSVNNKISAVPRHSEIKDLLCKKICKDLGIIFKKSS